MSSRYTSPVRSVDELLEERAHRAHNQLSAEGRVMYRAQIMDRKAARRAFWWHALRDFWRIFEALIAIGLVAGMGFVVNLLIGLFLQ